MDRRPALTPNTARSTSEGRGTDKQNSRLSVAPDVRPVTVEQAVFTSIRSPMGQGYRLVAPSPGLLPDEKREIVQRAPSHGNLRGSAGLASFTLRSGRHCVFICRDAGVEQTARGGYRIHTHALVLDPAAYRRFGADPFRVEAAALRAIDPKVFERPPTAMTSKPLALEPATCDADTKPFDADHVDGALRLLAAVLNRERLLIVDMPAARDVLRWVLSATPAAYRPGLSFSYGLKYAPARKFQVVSTELDATRRARIANDEHVDVLSWPDQPPTAKALTDWCEFVRDWHTAGRMTDIAALADELTAEDTPDALRRVTSITRDLERIAEADQAQLDTLATRHPRDAESTDAYACRLKTLHEEIAHRREELEQAEDEADSTDGD